MGSYRTVATEAKVEFRVEQSEFIGWASPTADREAAQGVVSRLRQNHRDATHVCYAFRLGDAPGAETYSTDHGEPSGTAGKPILGAILRRDLTDVTVVVVRYFGGRKLGVRGLIEAYGETAGAALEAAGLVVRQRLLTLRLACPYAQFPGVARLVRQAGGELGPPVYDEYQATLRIKVPPEVVPGLKSALAALAAHLEEP